MPARALKSPAKAVIRRVYPRLRPHLKSIYARMEAIFFAVLPEDPDAYFWRIYSIIEAVTGGDGIRMLSGDGPEAAAFRLVVRRSGMQLRIALDRQTRRHVLSHQVRGRWLTLGTYPGHLDAALACARLAMREREASRRLPAEEDPEEGHPIPPLFDIGSQWRSERHRAGWGEAVDALAGLHGAGRILLDAFVESNFLWQRSNAQAYERPWVGFIHNPPNIPDLACYDGLGNQALFEEPAWRRSLPHCQGLFCLSEYHRAHLEKLLPVRVEALVHPTAPAQRRFDFDAFVANPEPKIVQVGVWLRNPRALERLQTTRLKKVRLHSGMPGHQQVLRSLGEEASSPSVVDVLPYQDDEAYDELLSRNLGFLNLFDASANNTVVECIVRETPLLVNRLPALEEYLGRDYPFFYEDLEEAGRKCDDLAVIRAAHEYLRALPKERFSGEFFLRSLLNSRIVRELDTPKRHTLIFAQARTGSSTLLRALNSHQRLRLLGEPFNRRRKEWGDGVDLPVVTDSQSLKQVLRTIEKDYNGIKHISGRFHFRQTELNHDLLRRGYEVIFLTRRNLLQSALSGEISRQAGHWGTDRSRLLAHAFEPVSLGVLEDRIRGREEQTRHYRAFLKDEGIRFLDITYEELFGPRVSIPERLAVLDRVFTHLHLRMPADEQTRAQLVSWLDPAQTKLNTAETYARIPNLAEIERALGGRGWGELNETGENMK